MKPIVIIFLKSKSLAKYFIISNKRGLIPLNTVLRIKVQHSFISATTLLGHRFFPCMATGKPSEAGGCYREGPGLAKVDEMEE